MGKLTKTWSWSRRLTPIWIGYWLCLFLSTHLPIPVDTPMIRRGGDKLIHFLLYFVLALLGGKRLLDHQKHRKYPVFIIWALIYAVFAMGDEITQDWVGRNMSVYDWLADVAGIVSATWILTTYARRIPPDEVEAVVA